MTGHSNLKFVVYSTNGSPRFVEIVKSNLFLVSGLSSFVRTGATLFEFEGGPLFEVNALFYDFGIITAVEYFDKIDVGMPSVLVSVCLD